MMLDELSGKVTRATDSEGIEVEEHHEKQYTIIRSPKRTEYIRITTIPRFGNVKVLYESGKEIPGLEGSFTSMSEAIKQVKRYLNSSNQTPAAKYKERWGDKPVPELKTKRRRKTKDASPDNQDINVA